MSSMSGYVTYVDYMAGTKKGQTSEGDLFNGFKGLGDVNPNYTSNVVVEEAAYADLTTNHTTATLMWTPVLKVESVKKFAGNSWSDLASTDYTVDETAGTVTLNSGLSDGQKIKIAYVYNNIVVPQNDLPTLKAEMKSIALIAKARRIAVKSYAA